MEHDRRRSRRITVYRAEAAEPRSRPEAHAVEYDCVADALHFACRDLREGRRRPLEIVEDGVVIYDAAAIEAACRTRRGG